MKKTLFKIYVAIEKTIIVILSVLFILIDRVLSTLIITRDIPSIYLIKEVELYQKDMIKRYKKRGVILALITLIYFAYLWIYQTITIFKTLF